jgi:enterobactin synthetase component D
MPAENNFHSADTAERQLARVLDALSAEHGGQFFASVAQVLPHDEHSLPYFLARFRMELFAPELFERHGIDCPPHIRNSVVKRQAEFIAGRICARSILDAYGQGKHVVAVGTHREPLWPAGFLGSITHSGLYAAAIACPAQGIAGIGIDIETIIKGEARQAMMDMVVNAEEAEYLRRMAGTVSFDSLLTLVFSAKESFFKAAFPQVKAYFDFDAVKVFEIDLQQRIVRFSCTQTLSPGLWQGQVHQAHFDFIGDTSLFSAVLLKDTKLATAGAVNSDSYASDAISV